MNISKVIHNFKETKKNWGYDSYVTSDYLAGIRDAFDYAIDYLKKEQPKNTCPYCGVGDNDFRILNANTTALSTIEIAIDCLGDLRVRSNCDDFTFEHQDVVNINYCPVCGRKFNE